MKISQYQELVSNTMNTGLSREQAISNYALGLAGEVGEVIEPLKKHLYHGRSLDVTNLTEELADIAWYIAAVANTLGINLDDALEKNVAKLKARYPNGFQTKKE